MDGTNRLSAIVKKPLILLIVRRCCRSGMDTSVSQTSGVVRWFCRVILVCLLVLVEWCRRLRSCIAFAVAFVKGDTGQCKQTGKKPASLKCVSLVISQPHLDALDIAKTAQIASWCLKMGIRYVFAFDPEGSVSLF